MIRLRLFRIEIWLNRLWRFLKRIGWQALSALPLSPFRRVAGAVLVLAIFVGLLVTVQTALGWQAQRAGVLFAVASAETKMTPAEAVNIQNEMRNALLQALSWVFGIFALYITFRRVKVDEQGHITDRYAKAIKQLGALTAAGKPNVEVRLGAIYALERIAKDSPRDHWTIMEVLAAYVRQNAPKPAVDPTDEENKRAIAKGPATEIQAILAVLGRRRRGLGREHEGQHLDLRDSDLRGAIFDGVHVEGASFDRAHLQGASFDRAHLQEASFVHAHLQGAHFDNARLKAASFHSARMEGAHFSQADVTGATFTWAFAGGAVFDSAQAVGAVFVSAHIEGARFSGAHLEGARLSKAHLEKAAFDSAHLNEADFQDAEGLAVDQFLLAEGWEQAHFDEAFSQKLK
jgi:uncharacterized protein YjbI with pentapeptide repeats